MTKLLALYQFIEVQGKNPKYTALCATLYRMVTEVEDEAGHLIQDAENANRGPVTFVEKLEESRK